MWQLSRGQSFFFPLRLIYLKGKSTKREGLKEIEMAYLSISFSKGCKSQVKAKWRFIQSQFLQGQPWKNIVKQSGHLPCTSECTKLLKAFGYKSEGVHLWLTQETTGQILWKWSQPFWALECHLWLERGQKSTYASPAPCSELTAWSQLQCFPNVCGHTQVLFVFAIDDCIICASISELQVESKLSRASNDIQW